MATDGYIKLHRSLLEWEWFADAKMLKAWLYILMKANWCERRWCGRVIPRGSFVTSREKLAQEIDMSAQNIRTILSRLKHTGEIKVESTNKYTIITVCNYESYQQDDEADQPTDNQQTTNNQPQLKNIKNINNNNTNTTIGTKTKFEIPRTIKAENFAEWLRKESGDEWKDVAMMQLGITSREELELNFEKFQYEALAQGVEEETEREIKSHFMNQRRIVLRRERGNENGSNRSGNRRVESDPFEGWDWNDGKKNRNRKVMVCREADSGVPEKHEQVCQ